jgi:hypothetical protein
MSFNRKSYFALFCSMSLFLLCTVAYNVGAYNITDFNNDAGTFASSRNNHVKAMTTMALSMRSVQVMTSRSDQKVFSGELYYGGTLFPPYIESNNDGNRLFDNHKVIDESGTDRVRSLGAGFQMGFSKRVVFSLVGGFSVPRSFGEEELNTFHVGVNGYYRFLGGDIRNVGLLWGIGVGYSAGQMNKNMASSSTSITVDTVVFKGKASSMWDYSTIRSEVFIHKQMFWIEFYSRLGYSYNMGSVNTKITGEFLGNFVERMLDSHEAVNSIVTTAGIEIGAGTPIRIGVEAGRDWYQSSLMASIGIRFSL